MPRNLKCRKVCSEFPYKKFMPVDNGKEVVNVNVDELEAIRLMDLEGLDQEKAAFQMEISRGTFQRILYSGRKKIAEALCGGKGIVIGGGHYEICEMCCQYKKNCKKRCGDKDVCCDDVEE